MTTIFEYLQSERVRAMPVHIIGVGGTGSNLAYELVKAGVKVMHIYDDDTVSTYNWRNQRYNARAHVGKPKVECLAEMLARDCNGFTPIQHNYKVGRSNRFKGIVFFCVDTMHARKEVFDGCIRGNKDVPLLIDVRIDAYTNRIVTLDPTNEMHLAIWDSGVWYPDQEMVFQQASCGSPIAVPSSASRAAAEAAWQLFRYDMQQRGEDVPLPNEIICHMKLTVPEPVQYIIW